jgi:glycosyltransferase involved in cell wall biosynthesis
MKLLYIHHKDICKNTANNIQVINMCYAFSEHNNTSVTLLIPSFYTKEITIRKIENQLGCKINFKIEFYKYYNFKKINLSTFISLIVFKIKHFRKYSKKHDTVFTRHILTYLCLRNKENKYIYEVHNNMLFDRRLLNYIAKKLLSRSKYLDNLKLICISENLKKYWESNSNIKNIISIHDGFNSIHFSNKIALIDAKKTLELDESKKHISYIGSLYFDREIETIIDTAKEINECEFIIVGGPEINVNFYKEYALKNNVSNIKFVGPIDHSKIPTYMFASDILLALWSKKVLTINYCSPLKLFEYMASGRTIIAHDFITIKEVINEKNGYLIDRNDKNALTKEIKSLLNKSEPELSLINDQARKDAFELYSWQIRTRKILENL